MVEAPMKTNERRITTKDHRRKKDNTHERTHSHALDYYKHINRNLADSYVSVTKNRI